MIFGPRGLSILEVGWFEGYVETLKMFVNLGN